MTLDVIFWIGSVVYLLAAIGLLLNICYNQHCIGLSIKSQFLYTLVFITRHLDLFAKCPLNADTAFKIAYTVLSCCTLLSMLFFRRTYQKKHDTSRIEMLIIPCIVMAVLVNHKSTFFGMIGTFSIYLEAIAMLPQFQFIDKARHVHPSAFYYVDAVGISKALISVYRSYQYYHGKETLNLVVAANMVQLVLYCDFFFRLVIPGACPRGNKIPRAAVATTQTDAEDDIPETGHLAGNVSTVLLAPRVSAEDSGNRVNLSRIEMMI